MRLIGGRLLTFGLGFASAGFIFNGLIHRLDFGNFGSTGGYGAEIFLGMFVGLIGLVITVVHDEYEKI